MISNLLFLLFSLFFAYIYLQRQHINQQGRYSATRYRSQRNSVSSKATKIKIVEDLSASKTKQQGSTKPQDHTDSRHTNDWQQKHQLEKMTVENSTTVSYKPAFDKIEVSSPPDEFKVENAAPRLGSLKRQNNRWANRRRASLIVATNINDAKTTRQNKSNNMITAKLCWDNNDCSSLPLKLQANDYKVDQRCILIDNAVTMRQRLEVQSNESANDCSNFNQIKINNQIAESIRQVIELEQQIHIHQACSPSSSPKTVVEPLESAYCHTSSKFQTQYKQKIQHSSISNGQSFKLEQSNNGDATELSSSILQEKNQLKRNSLIRRSSIRSPRQNSWRNSRTKHPFSEFATLDNIMAEVADEEQLANNVSLQNDCNSNALPSVENSLTELFILGARNDHYEYQTAVMREDSQYILPSPRLFMDRRKAQHLSLKATVKDHSTNDYFQAKRRPLTYHPSNKYSDNSGDDDDDDNHRFNRLSSVVQLQTPCDSGIANIPVTPTTSRSISFPLTLPTSPIASPRSVHRANLISADAGTIRPSSLFYDDSDNDEPNPSNVQSDVQLKTKINTLSNSNATTTTADHANTTHLKHSKVAAYLPSIVHGHSSPILSMEPNYIILKKNTSYIN